MSLRSVYLHLPFCESKCHYCDFFSFAEEKFSDSAKSSIYESIFLETKTRAKDLGPLETLFLGGGTPSLAPIESLVKIFEFLPTTRETEITLEANPSSVTLKKAEQWFSLGINRVSLGTQALRDDRLKWLGRVHSVDQIHQALDNLSASPIPRISIDYMVGVPGQTKEMIFEELTSLLTRHPRIDHLSVYLLTLEPNHSRYSQLPDDQTQLDHLLETTELLGRLGFDQYEISNFSKQGQESRHNRNYWFGGSYLGLGPSAHSFDKATQKRWKNWSNLARYQQDVREGTPPIEWTETLTPEQLRLEFLMLGLRTREGIDLTAYQARFGRDFTVENGEKLAGWQKQDLIEYQPRENRLRLTKRGFFVCDQILKEFN